MPRLTYSLALVGLVAIAAVGSGCGGTVIDDVKVEEQLKDYIASSLGKDVTAVDCPSGVEVKAGATFECSVTLAGGRDETAELKIRNEDADVSFIDLRPAG